MTTQFQSRPTDPLIEPPAQSSTVRIEFDLEPRDLLSFVQYHYSAAPGVRRQRFVLAGLGFGTLAALPLMVALGSDRPTLETIKGIWPMFLGPIGFLMCFPIFYRWGHKRTARRLLDEGDRRGYYGPRYLSLEFAGIREAMLRGETVRTWASIQKLVLWQDCALIYTSPTEAFVVPGRAFKNQALFVDFLAHVADRAQVQVIVG